jgi:hypothetical protein
MEQQAHPWSGKHHAPFFERESVAEASTEPLLGKSQHAMSKEVAGRHLIITQVSAPLAAGSLCGLPECSGAGNMPGMQILMQHVSC